MRCVAVIPARGGSSRIPRKNVREFCGRPMIAWPIATALESGCFERVIVSTDDPHVAEVAREYGAETPFVRPAELSDDQTGTRPVVNHAIGWLEASGYEADFVCLLYATAAFVTAEDLRRGLSALAESDRSFAFSVTTFGHPVQRALRILPGGGIEMVHPEHAETRSQDLEESFHDAGQFYWGRPQAFLAGTPLFSEASLPILVDRHRVQDIDTPEDWERARLLFRMMQEES